jgi:hypothetical protein
MIASRNGWIAEVDVAIFGGFRQQQQPETKRAVRIRSFVFMLSRIPGGLRQDKVEYRRWFGENQSL